MLIGTIAFAAFILAQVTAFIAVRELDNEVDSQKDHCSTA